jgi:hypothetical protein
MQKLKKYRIWIVLTLAILGGLYILGLDADKDTKTTTDTKDGANNANNNTPTDTTTTTPNRRIPPADEVGGSNNPYNKYNDPNDPYYGAPYNDPNYQNNPESLDNVVTRGRIPRADTPLFRKTMVLIR